MGFRSLISLFLVLLPIGATLGLLLGWDTVRVAQGLQPIFVDNSADTEQYCQKSYGISPGSVGQRYTLNPNQWGWNPSLGGGLCMNVTAFGNETYATPYTAPAWSVTWQYPPGPETQPVHAFPNIALDGDEIFPTTIDTIRHLKVEVDWTYGVGRRAARKLNTAALTTANLAANVAIDMFLDADSGKAQDTKGATYEVMVWLGTFGVAAQPIGFKQGPAETRIVNTTSFELFYGQNSLKQYVLTWQATTNTIDFVGDLSPLLANLEPYYGPAATDYLGYMGMGSETYFSDKVVTFNVPNLAINVKTR